MVANYSLRFTYTSYAGISYTALGGYEQVTIAGTTTYYVIDYYPSNLVIYNENWIYQSYKTLPLPLTYTLIYIGGYFYLSATSYFYKTDSNFNLLASNCISNVFYRGFDYDASLSLFYVASTANNRLDVFTIQVSHWLKALVLVVLTLMESLCTMVVCTLVLFQMVKF